MKSIHATLSDRAHIALKSITQATNKNQSDVLTEILERIEVLEMIKELNKK